MKHGNPPSLGKSAPPGKDDLLVRPIGCLEFTNFSLGRKTHKCYETDELSNPRPTQPKKTFRLTAAFGLLFSHSKQVFRGLRWMLYRKQTARNPTQPNSPQAPYQKKVFAKVTGGSCPSPIPGFPGNRGLVTQAVPTHISKKTEKVSVRRRGDMASGLTFTQRKRGKVRTSGTRVSNFRPRLKKKWEPFPKKSL